MDILLLTLQIILGIKLLATALSHGLQHQKPVMQAAIQKMGGAVRFWLKLVSILCLLGGLGLLLGSALDKISFLATISAGFMAVMLLISIVCHLRSREKPALYADIILFIMAAFPVVANLIFKL